MRTNQKDKRREQASLVVLTNYYTSSLGEDGDIMPLVTIRGSVHNYSSALVTDAQISIEMKRGTARRRLSLFDRWFRPQKKVIAFKRLQVEDDITCTILPDTDIRYVLHLPDESHIAAEEVDIKLAFMDANSVAWERPFMGVPVEPKRPGRIRGALITRLEWKDWDKEHQDGGTPSDELSGEEGPKVLTE